MNDILKKHNILKVGHSVLESEPVKKERINLKAVYNAKDLVERSSGSSLLNLEIRMARSFFKILVVDDEPEVAYSMQLILKDELRFENVFTATSVKEAWDIIQNEGDFDLILSDYRMGEEDGNILYERIQTIPKRKPTFMIVSGFTDFETNALKQSGVLILPKPLTVKKLSTVVLGFYIRKIETILNIKLKTVD